MSPRIAIVDYGLGNLFSVRQACEHNGLSAQVTHDAADLAAADAVILPGVGAFGDAMAALRRLDLVRPIVDAAQSGRPLLGVCLGFQLLMERSEEYGEHEGLGIFAGSVKSLRPHGGEQTKVPSIGWQPVVPARGANGGFSGTMLAGVPHGSFFYFVHSYYVEPAASLPRLAESEFGSLRYCCAIQRENVFGCQFHPERSGASGLRVYENLRRSLAAEE